jgi:uncharacterized protein
MSYRSIFRMVVLLYVLLCAIFYGCQHLLFFQPKALAANHVLNFSVPIKTSSAKIPFDADTEIDVVRFLPDSGKPKGVVLFFHGNRYNVEHYSTYAPYFTQRGYECWMPDYPGYGRSRGTITAPLLEQVGLQLYKMARVKYPAQQITVYGKSLGTGIASFLAAAEPCRQLVLETPYYSLSDLAQTLVFVLPVRWLMRFELNTYQHFAQVSAPITMLHGTQDALIPYAHAVALLDHAKPADAFYTVINGQHNNLPSFPVYHQTLDSLLR